MLLGLGSSVTAAAQVHPVTKQHQSKHMSFKTITQEKHTTAPRFQTMDNNSSLITNEHDNLKRQITVGIEPECGNRHCVTDRPGLSAGAPHTN